MGQQRAILAIGVFLLFASVTAFLAGTTLVWPGTALDRMWVLNARAHDRLAPFGRVVGIPFLLLGGTLLLAAAGWFKRRVWGWRLTVGIIAVQLLGDAVNLFMGRMLEGATGVVIAGALLFYLTRRSTRVVFDATGG